MLSSQPQGVIVEHVGNNMLMTHVGAAAAVPDAGFVSGSVVNYAP
jgi:hypothetical protein